MASLKDVTPYASWDTDAENAEFIQLQKKRPAELMLLLAVLEDAIYCFKSNLFAKDRRSKQLFAEVEAWFQSGGDQLFSFETICEVLDFDAGYLRAGLQRWKEKQLKQHGRKQRRRENQGVAGRKELGRRAGHK